MSRPEVLVSYAQNHEDIVLARIFEPWKRHGHWIDIGAGHPTFDSVTRLFYDFGWTGLNIEPLSEEFSLLCAERPADLNINCAVGTEVGRANLYVGPPHSRGTSSLVRPSFTADDSTLTIEDVEVRTLASIMADAPWPIDFVKIDVEGMEQSVISSAIWSESDIPVVIVEATLQNSSIPTHESWESLLTDAGYSFVLFDGLNRYYELSKANSISRNVWYPATVQDCFTTAAIRDLDRQVEFLSRSFLEAEKYAHHLEELFESTRLRASEATEVVTAISLELRKSQHELAQCQSARIATKSLVADLKGQIEVLRQRIECGN